MNFVINFKGFMILELGNFSEIIFFEREDLSETSRSGSGLSVKFTEETNFSKIFINM